MTAIFERLIAGTRMLGLLFSRQKRAAPQKIYDILSTNNNLAENSLYLNLGYWEKANTYDDACAALGGLLGQRAGLAAGDHILDVGCGFGDQDDYWLRHFDPAHITAINITSSQLSIARKRFTDTRIDFRAADATALPFDSASFDKVLALESAFHFEPREAFFDEALRVLKPGGVLGLADIVVARAPKNAIARFVAKIGRAMWQTPECNVYGQEIYCAKLEAAGFSDVKVLSITPHVFAPFKAYAKRRVMDAEIRNRVHPFLRHVWGASHGGFDNLEYLIITAVKA